jgi:hypothetical protein
MKAPKGPAGVKITIKPLSKAAVAKAREAPAAKAGEAFRKMLPGAKKR